MALDFGMHQGQGSVPPPITVGNGGLYGDYAGLIGGQLTTDIKAGGMTDALKQLLTLGTKKISSEANKSRESVRESFASSGFRGSGANLYNQIFSTENDAITGLNAQIGQQASQNKAQMLQQLLGLTQFQGSQNLNKAQMDEQRRQYEKTFNENVRQFGLEYALKQRELDMQDSSGWGDIFGKILGVGVGAFTGGVGGGLADLLF